MRPGHAALILGCLFIAGCCLAWLLSSRDTAVAVITGGLLPIAISGISLVVFFARKSRSADHHRYQRFVLINFLVKVILIGGWTALVLLTTSLPRTPFVVSLLVNFLAWHIFEAYRYQSTFGKLTARVEEGITP
ncbi:MAG: hypothetical protein JSU61_05105 [Fidelibacterota bacterium]|nr:MAG: hypothetical protein JSU61_05105 [Candidatus Neomarinimicrobiota bacterium]